MRLLSQPVNLGFAGGVNAGVAATQAEMIVLLNQDCLVQPRWREELVRVFEAEPGCSGGLRNLRCRRLEINHVARRSAAGLRCARDRDRPEKSVPG